MCIYSIYIMFFEIHMDLMFENHSDNDAHTCAGAI